MTTQEMITLEDMLAEQLVRESREDLLRFTLATMPTFVPAGFHRRYYKELTEFAAGNISKLMVFIPPQHGKSEGSTRRLPAYILGRKPDTKVAVVSYSAPKARKFNREIQRVIDTEEYHAIFPNTYLNASNVTTVAGSWLRNADECEIVGHRGGFKTVGVGGALTGEPVDILIMDDIYKDAKTAWSPTVRESVEDWYDTVAETRLHNDSQQLIVFTRWHENDLAGKLLREQGEYHPITNPRGWVVVVYPAIKVGGPTEYDPREEGEPLWPERHNLEKLESVRDRNSHVFESLYQQNPKPVEGLMYEQGFREYDVIPYSEKIVKKAYIDTADTGADFLCGICYTETPSALYVTDVIFTTKAMEYTEPKTAEMITRNQTQYAIVESNNGGRGFARNVETQCRILGNTKTRFKWFYQGDNKAIRIFTKSADVQNLLYFPRGWDRMWPDFYNQIANYMKVGKNSHDDACFVAGTKVATIHGEKNIEDVKIGEYVITPFGVRKVIDSECTGRKIVITNIGLTGTPHHKVFAQNRFDCLTGIKQNEVSLLSYQNMLQWKYKKLLCSMILNTGLWGRENIILANQIQIQDGKVLKDCMLQFGSFITKRKFQRAIAFIIRMVITLIMTLATWSAYKLGSIYQIMLKEICKILNIWKEIGDCSKGLDIKRPSGTEAKRVENGIVKTVKHVNGLRRMLYVSGAKRSLSHFGRTLNFVQTRAAKNTEQNTNELNIQGSVPIVEPNSRQQKSSNQSLKEHSAQERAQIGTEQKVYNITVDKDGCYYANRVLVSNCDTITGAVEWKGKGLSSSSASEMAKYL